MLKIKKRNDTEAIEVEIPQESNLSIRLSDSNSKQVISLILAMIFILPFMEISFWFNTYNNYLYEFDNLIDTYNSNYNLINVDSLQQLMRNNFFIIQQYHGYDVNNPTNLIDITLQPIMYFNSDLLIMKMLFDDPIVQKNGWFNSYVATPVLDLRESEINY